MRKPILLIALCVYLCQPGAAQTGAGFGPGGVGTTGAAGNVGLWLRADAIPGVSNSAALSAWPDVSGNGNNAAGTDAARPVFSTSTGAINGRPVVRFDGSNDSMRISTSNGALNTGTALTYFAVLRMNNVPSTDATGTQRGILSKRVNAAAAVTHSYNLYFQRLGGGTNNYRLHYNVASGTAAPEVRNSTQNYGTGTMLLGFGFDGAQTSTNRGITYGNGAAPQTFSHTLTTINTNSTPITLGRLSGAANTFAQMDVAEIIQLNRRLNEAERVILENYLSAKYNLPVNTDRYAHDTPGTGYYGNDVAGIGRTSSTSIQNDARGTGIVRVNNPSDLDDGNYLLWGHNGLPLTQLSPNVPTAFLATGQRLARVWRFDETGNVGNATIVFDVSQIPSLTAANYTNLRLFLDDNGNFNNAVSVAPSAASSNFTGSNRLVGFLVNFNSIDDEDIESFDDGSYFTLGTINASVTPLPVTFLSVRAQPQAGRVAVSWTTANEKDNAYFTVERSADGEAWQPVATLPGAGDSRSPLAYTALDMQPLAGLAYYRVQQTDLDGQSSYSQVVSARTGGLLGFVLAPNPANGDVVEVQLDGTEPASELLVSNALGRVVYRQALQGGGPVALPVRQFANGVYAVTVRSRGGVRTARLVVQR